MTLLKVVHILPPEQAYIETIQPGRALLPRAWFDGLFGGNGYFAGTADGIVTVAGVPSSRRVIAIDRQTMFVVRQVWSNPDGTYRINHLSPAREFIIMAIDDNREYDPFATDGYFPHVD